MAKLTIISVSKPDGSITKDVTLDNISDGSKVYCLVFGLSDIDENIKRDLKNLGTEYENNLFVGFLNMADPRYKDMAKYFGLKHLPAIVLTAESSLSSTQDCHESAFVRLDNDDLLSHSESVAALVTLLYNLFITREVSEAISIVGKGGRFTNLRDMAGKRFFTDLGIKIIDKYNIDFSLGQFKVISLQYDNTYGKIANKVGDISDSLTDKESTIANFNRVITVNTFEDLVSRSGLIFICKILDINATTIKSIISNSHTAIVRVNKMLYDPGITGNQEGKDLTVHLKNGTSELGREIVLFTQPYLYANEGIAVKEIGRLESEGVNASTLEKKVKYAVQKLADISIFNKINISTLVIIGEIIDIRLINSYGSSVPNKAIIDADIPIYCEANVKVSEVIKGGSIFANEVKVIFDNNRDLSHYKSPKFHVADSGIFFMKERVMEQLNNRKVYTCFDKGDFQSSVSCKYKKTLAVIRRSYRMTDNISNNKGDQS